MLYTWNQNNIICHYYLCIMIDTETEIAYLSMWPMYNDHIIIMLYTWHICIPPVKFSHSIISTLWDLTDYNTSGSCVLHHLLSLLNLMPIKSMMPSNHLILCHLLLLPSIFPSIRVFPMSQFFASGGQSIGASASVSVFSMNILGWYPLVLTSLFSLQSKGLSRVFSNSTVQKQQFLGLQFPYGPALTSIHNYWKNYISD